MGIFGTRPSRLSPQGSQDENLARALVVDISTAPVEERLKPILEFMNRFVFGFGVEGDENCFAAAGPCLKEMGYLASSRMGKEERDAYRAREG